MGYGYGLELRKRIVESYENGEGSVREIAERFKVSPTTVQSYRKLKRTTGGLDPRPVSGGTEPILGEKELEKVRQVLEEQPDATTEELADEIARRRIGAVSRPTMGRALQRLGITRKKNTARKRARHSARAEAAQEVRAEGQEAAGEKVHLRR
jgi:transposase